MHRRTFMLNSGMLTAGILASRIDSFALSPIDPILVKKLDPTWVKSLYERGNPTTYLKSKNELQYIGMPVGGIMCGMVYLGGDGRLWLWDVFNKNQSGVVYKNIPWHEKIQFNFDYVRPFDGANYVEPVKDVRPLDQGFSVKMWCEDWSLEKKLEEKEWDEVSFEATYPVATIRFTDKKQAVAVSLKAYSPFIPLNENDSALPVTILSYTIENNRTDRAITAELTGWLENKAAIYSANDPQYYRVNEPAKDQKFKGVFMRAASHNWADESFWHAPDFGNFCIASLNGESNADIGSDKKIPFNEKLVGSVTSSISVPPQSSATLNFAISWYFPNLTLDKLKNEGGRHYRKRFKNSIEVIRYVHDNFESLSKQTLLWADTWYKESTLPHWFLERTFLNISTLATTTCHWFESGRFYAWEGIGSCPGTCNHVWQYAQAVGRIFPALERDTRERVDLGVGFYDDGHIGFRAEYDTQPAVDGQAGRILGIYREHQMSSNNEFLKGNWPKTKKAVEFLLKQDTNNDGMTDTTLENTLDAKWPGEIAWIVGLSITAIKAAQLMAEEMGDTDFATKCSDYVSKGKANMEKHLFNGEYFIHRPDPVKGRDGVIGSYNTCHIDQVYGQSWAFQVGLGRTLDREKTLSALKALWKYNFTTDVGPYLAEHHGGRPYALPGEGGMIMNTNPKNEDVPYGVKDAWQVTYFHECMSGFEHQVASHMMAEGMIEESLILTRAIHDRYSAKKRNPFNEVECSDHYARAMASYGTFVTACGFTYHGPKQEIGFAPKLMADNFRAAFVTAEGWGTYSQVRKGKKLECTIDVKSGKLAVKTFTVEKAGKGIRIDLPSVIEITPGRPYTVSV
ncbi:MAG TPA: GH116 family glycosyl-hydrolase [Cyclobacteriaceae bacterium]|nr:GH116 family glycosyl-hydrolase [Cyclobacteriaceae bacterium]